MFQRAFFVSVVKLGIVCGAGKSLMMKAFQNIMVKGENASNQHSFCTQAFPKEFPLSDHIANSFKTERFFFMSGSKLDLQ